MSFKCFLVCVGTVMHVFLRGIVVFYSVHTLIPFFARCVQPVTYKREAALAKSLGLIVMSLSLNLSHVSVSLSLQLER